MTLVLGLGNSILSDDGAGIWAVREVESRATSLGERAQGLVFAEASVGGLRLLEVLAGHERAILVDAIQTPGGRPGTVYQLKMCDLPSSLHSGSSHDLTLPEALELGRLLGMDLPQDDAIDVVAIEVEDVLTFGESCTPLVEGAIPAAAELVMNMVVPGGKEQKV